MNELERKVLQAVETLEDEADYSNVGDNIFGPKHSMGQTVKVINSLHALEGMGYISSWKAAPGHYSRRQIYRIEDRGEQALAGMLVENPTPPRYVGYTVPISVALLIIGFYGMLVLRVRWIPYAVTVGLILNTIWAKHLKDKYGSKDDSSERTPRPDRQNRRNPPAKSVMSEGVKKIICKFIRLAGLVGLAVIFLSLLSATYRQPGTALNIHTGITPLLKAEFPHSKADLETVYGAPDSEIRRVIAARPLPLMGEDFLPGWMIFLFALYKLMPYVTPGLLRFRYVFLSALIAPMVIDYFAVHQMVTVANATVFTDEMAASLWKLSFLKWESLFAATVMCVGPLARSHPMLKFGDYLLMFASLAGMMSFSWPNAEWLLAPCVFALFIGLCGITAMFLLRPEFLFHIPLPVTPSSDDD